MQGAGLRALLAAAVPANGAHFDGGAATAAELRAELVRITRRCQAAELELLCHAERDGHAAVAAEEALQRGAIVRAECGARAAALRKQCAGQERGAVKARSAARRVELRFTADGELLTRPGFLRRFGRYYEWNHAPTFCPPLRKPRMRPLPGESPEPEATGSASGARQLPEPEGPASQLPARPEAGRARPPQAPAPQGPPSAPQLPPSAGMTDQRQLAVSQEPCGDPPRGASPPPAAGPPPAAAAGQAECAEPRRRPCLAPTPVARTLEVRRGPDGRPKGLGLDIVEAKGRVFVTGLAPGGAAESAGVPRQGLLVSIGGLRVDAPGEAERIEALLERLDQVEVLVRPVLHAPPPLSQPSRPVCGARVASRCSSRSGSPAAHAPAPGAGELRARLERWLNETAVGGNPASCSSRIYDAEPLVAFAMRHRLEDAPPVEIYRLWVDCRAAEGEREAAGAAAAAEDDYVVL